MEKLRNTVFIVDGSLLYRQTMAQILKAELEVNTIEARDANELLNLLKKHNPSFIIYDFYSGENFESIMRKVRELRPESKVFVLGYDADTPLIEYFKKCGAFGFLNKSISDIDLLKEAFQNASLETLI